MAVYGERKEADEVRDDRSDASKCFALSIGGRSMQIFGAL